MTCKLDLSQFNGREDILRYALAAFLGVHPEEVVVMSIEEGSIKVIFAIERNLAHRLIAAFSMRERNLLSALQDFKVDSIKKKIVKPASSCEDATHEMVTNIKTSSSFLDLLKLARQPPLGVLAHATVCHFYCDEKVKRTKVAAKDAVDQHVNLKSSSNEAEFLAFMFLRDALLKIWSPEGSGGGGVKNRKDFKLDSRGIRS